MDEAEKQAREILEQLLSDPTQRDIESAKNGIVKVIAAALRARDEEISKLAVHKRLLFEENGRLLAEKEAGLWDHNHPVRAELTASREEIARLRAELNERAKLLEDFHKDNWSKPEARAALSLAVGALQDMLASFGPSSSEEAELLRSASEALQDPAIAKEALRIRALEAVAEAVGQQHAKFSRDWAPVDVAYDALAALESAGGG